MNRISLATLVFTAMFLGGCASGRMQTSQSSAETGNPHLRLQPDEMRKDLDFLSKTLRDVHPDPFSIIDEQVFVSELESINKSLREPLSRTDFFQKTAPLIAALGDGHTWLQAPGEEFAQYLSDGGEIFPFDIRIGRSGEMVIVNRFLPGDPCKLPNPGDRILAINGIRADSLVTKIIAGISGERMAFRYDRMSRQIHNLLRVHGIHPPYIIAYESLAYVSAPHSEQLDFHPETADLCRVHIPSHTAGRDTLTGGESAPASGTGKPGNRDSGPETGIVPIIQIVELPGIDRETMRSARDSLRQEETGSAASATTNMPYRYTRLEDNLAYIDFRSMVDLERFEGFLEEVFTDIRDNPPAGLIIDLRNNGGGNSRLGNQLLDYITDQPYRMSGGKSWKMSRQYRAQIRNDLPFWIRWVSYPPGIWIARVFRTEARMFMGRDGRIVHFEPGYTKPGRNHLRYHGPVVFLIGSYTYSSAMMLANAVEDYNLATLIGEETGGIPNTFGEVYRVRLPHSGLWFITSTARFIRANGDETNLNGVLPHIFAGGPDAGSLKSDDNTGFEFSRPSRVESPTQTSESAPRDPAMEAARNWILSADPDTLTSENNR